VAERRTPAQLRGDIRSERRELDAAIAALTQEGKRSVRLAGAVVAAGLATLVLWRIGRAVRRRRS
jgi:hypothetical protein